MKQMIRYRAMVVGFMVGLVLFRVLTVGVGLCLLSVTGLLMVQQYWLAMLVLVVGLLVYEGGYWLLVGKWGRSCPWTRCPPM
jgi:hypothetical protein